ncbi:MAG: 3-hydroxyacyl-CoA dehydrogenase/enoyl-CoA hydratase family protein [Saprospiraceae bacterium]|nr:3-hydroxyacyl-CoA dehydrogenase/enoyl-CoA hydratase family protein [Saprospiraceae bacterium]
MRRIRKVAVLGSGIMGSGIACHFANIGLDVLMLDILPREMSDTQKEDKQVRNSVAANALAAALKSKPAPLYKNEFAARIKVGNFEDDFEKINDCDWVIEVVVERLDIKKTIFEKVDKYRKAGSLVTSNTSGIPINMMAEGRSEDFRKHFCGTHFFNPPRYLRLFEIIPGPDTDPAIIDFFQDFGDRYLGKLPVHAKDTPAFIGNRIGIFCSAFIFNLTAKLGLRFEEVDRITSTPIGWPKSGTYRLGDLIGLDTAMKVIKGIKDNCPDDAVMNGLSIPKFVEHLIETESFGDKSGQGFYKKTNEKDENGKRIILVLNPETLEYEPTQKVKIASLDLTKQVDELDKKIKILFDQEDKGGQLIRSFLLGLFSYASTRIPEISDNLFNIDNAMKAGFAWQVGPFEYWDIIGVARGVELCKAADLEIPEWVNKMLAAGNDSFYKRKNGKLLYYNIESGAYVEVPGTSEFVILDNYRSQSPVHSNAESILHDIGDGVLCLEFTSKANAMGEGVLRGMNEAIQIAEEGNWKGLVIGNNAANFTVGANLMLIAMLAYQQEFDELNMAVNLFQQTTMRCRYSAIPVVAATQGYVFGGGCETIMHCDAAVCAAESYIGLVEVGVGLIPGGGGTKEFALRASDQFFEGDVMIPTLIEKFKTIALASVATSAHQAYDLGYLLPQKDMVEMNLNRNIARAKHQVLDLADNYTQPIQRQDIHVLGRSGLGALYLAANELKLGGYASEHDIKIAQKVAFVLCGGDLTGQQKVSEQYLLDLEREAFLSLCGEQKTLERIQHMLTTNKPLRN